MNRFKIGITATALILAVGFAGQAITHADAVSKVTKFNSVAAYQKVGQGKTDLMNYKSTVAGKTEKLNRELGAEEKILVTITLNKLATENHVIDLVEKYSLDVKQLRARAIESDTGLKATLAVAPENGQILDKNLLNNMVSGNNADFKGFIEITAEVPNGNLKALGAESLVFIADPSADHHLVANPKKDTMPGLFWLLEENVMTAE